MNGIILLFDEYSYPFKTLAVLENHQPLLRYLRYHYKICDVCHLRIAAFARRNCISLSRGKVFDCRSAFHAVSGKLWEALQVKMYVKVSH